MPPSLLWGSIAPEPLATDLVGLGCGCGWGLTDDDDEVHFEEEDHGLVVGALEGVLDQTDEVVTSSSDVQVEGDSREDDDDGDASPWSPPELSEPPPDTTSPDG